VSKQPTRQLNSLAYHGYQPLEQSGKGMFVSENHRTSIFDINPIDGASVQRASMSSNAWGYVALPESRQ